MNILSWNCQGLRRSTTVRALNRLVRKHNPFIVFLIETKQKQEKLERIRNRMGFVEGFYVDPLGLSSGLALWWKIDYGIHTYLSQNFNMPKLDTIS
ncbi:hypothetical protein ES288_D02G088000v1 [Gossypium darwinii]|uniref:Endonuclease/exonuclease/phosphatase domain-containing protein n=1 Tax=Gossypium darwinii TaxID=34276 RepID=A0A5D2DBK6_GOSDA|nr:hypothetical protein ES288_D02G088000v1 [Gossypium darwinii]